MSKEKFDFIQPVKDIPLFLKGFPKNLIKMIKKPVTSSVEVKERKKELFPFLYLCIALGIVLSVLSQIIHTDIISLIMIIPFIGILFCIFLFLILHKAKKKFNDIECNNCKARIEYGSNVNFVIDGRKFEFTKSKTENSRAGVNISVIGKEKIAVTVTCKCQNCGTEKTFNHTFVTAQCEKEARGVSAITADMMLMEMEKDVHAECEEGFEGKIAGNTTARGVKITRNRSIYEMVEGYFGNEISLAD